MDIYLVGGIAVALANGGFRRNHRVIDLAIFDTDLNEFHRHAASRGYYFTKKMGYTHISHRHDLNIYSRITPEEMMDEGYCKVLLRKPAIVQNVRKKMDCFDLFLMRYAGESIYFIDQEKTIPHDEFFPARSYPLENGTELLIPNLKYRPRLWTPNSKAGDEVYIAQARSI